MIIHRQQTIMFMTVAIIIAQAIQMIVRHLRIQAVAIVAVVVTKKPFYKKGFLLFKVNQTK
ncbi:hypothetical protein IDM32_06615 [Acinetobacter seifertii]|nr:hypothetical protein [Acinetobacter seifertii]